LQADGYAPGLTGIGRTLGNRLSWFASGHLRAF
jgi:hypothetical protein